MGRKAKPRYHAYLTYTKGTSYKHYFISVLPQENHLGWKGFSTFTAYGARGKKPREDKGRWFWKEDEAVEHAHKLFNQKVAKGYIPEYPNTIDPMPSFWHNQNISASLGTPPKKPKAKRVTKKEKLLKAIEVRKLTAEWNF